MEKGSERERKQKAGKEGRNEGKKVRIDTSVRLSEN